MTKNNPVHSKLLDETIALTAECGLEKLSLRAIASRSGCSTGAIFQSFGSKSGLLGKALARAREHDKRFHGDLEKDMSGYLSGHAAFSDLLTWYIGTRAGQEVARFLSEVFFKANQIEMCGDHMREWHAMRTLFWTSILDRLNVDPDLASIVSSYTIMEEVYAQTLIDRPRYRLLLGETVRALTAVAFGQDIGKLRKRSLSERLDTQPLSFHGKAKSDANDNAVREQLLEQAVLTIVKSGTSAATQRELARKAGVSASMVAYHFGNMKAFVNEAIWRALMKGIPVDLDPDNKNGSMPSSLDEWFTMIDEHVRSEAGEVPAGFYTGFSRISGEACLLARFQPQITELVGHLRALEGWGTFRVSSHLKEAGYRIGRDHAAAFGVWVKAEAMLRQNDVITAHRDVSRIADAARLIFPTARTATE